MKVAKLFFLFFGSLLVVLNAEISTNLVEKYFISLKSFQSAVLILCKTSDFTQLGRMFNDRNVYFTYYSIGMEKLELTSFLTRFFYGSCGVLVDGECPGVMEVLQNASTTRHFNLTYSWMIFGAPGENFDTFLDPILNIDFSSDLVYVESGQDNSTKLDLIDVYSLGRHRGSSLIGMKFAEFDLQEKNLKILVDLYPKFDKYHRADFKGFQLKAVVTIDRDNVTEADVQPLLAQPGKTPGIATFVKYHAHLFYLLQEIYNYTMKYRVTRAWAGHLPSGFRLGLLGVMTRGEADISLSGVFPYINRFAEYDFVHRSYQFKIGFVFRVGSDASASDSSLLAPLENDVWISLIVTIFIFLLVCLVTRMIFLVTKHRAMGSTAKDLVDLFAALCQQGVDPMPSSFVQRIAIFMTLFLAFFLYNYYTSSVVGVLLSSPVKGPTTPEEILASTYKLSFDDVGYHRILFRETKNPTIKQIYSKKLMGSKRGPSDLPIYAGIRTAVPYIKSGEYAFHCELTEAYSIIVKDFDASDICDLRAVTGLMITELLVAILVKYSQYSEMMRIGFVRLTEVGFVKRALSIYWKEKPECTSGITVFAVGFQAVSAAFYVLMAGMTLSLLLLGLEIAWKRRYSYRRSTSVDSMIKPLKRL
ncbi:uncharacterized protein DMENIID0001_156400 [Sergentomyia squamirostris]